MCKTLDNIPKSIFRMMVLMMVGDFKTFLSFSIYYLNFEIYSVPAFILFFIVSIQNKT